MEFDRLTVSLLEAGPNASRMDERKADALQDAHMAFLATLHESGKLQAAGPCLGAADRPLRGICLHRLPPEEVRALFERDPLVRAGRLKVQVLTWMVPKGAVEFLTTRFPHSQAEL
jgi:uncharacterized protein